MKNKKAVHIVGETRIFHLSNGFSVKFEPPSSDDIKAHARARASLYDSRGRMVDYLLEGEGFDIQNTKMCEKLAVDIYECFKDMYFSGRQEQ